MQIEWIVSRFSLGFPGSLVQIGHQRYISAQHLSSGVAAEAAPHLGRYESAANRGHFHLRRCPSSVKGAESERRRDGRTGRTAYNEDVWGTPPEGTAADSHLARMPHGRTIGFHFPRQGDERERSSEV